MINSEAKTSEEIYQEYVKLVGDDMYELFSEKLWLPADKSVLIADVEKMIGEWLGIDKGEYKITINNNIVGFKKLIKKLNSLKEK